VGQSLSHLDHTHYHGTVRGDPASYVYGSIRSGVFDGQIHTGRDGTFYVERIQRYTPQNNGRTAGSSNSAAASNSNSSSRESDSSSSSVHSVIYHDSHVKLPVDVVGGCAVEAEVKAWMENIQNSAVEQTPSPAAAAALVDVGEGEGVPTLTADPATDPSPEYKYTAAANRVKRALKPPTNR
jgi:hypothetical protein